MSQVAISGNASGTGTLTIAAPNTNSNYTLTLPAATGTVASIASVNNNGVVYANSSGQPTTGTAFVFDGTNVGIGTSSPNDKVQVSSASDLNINVTQTTVALTARYGCDGSGAIMGCINNSNTRFVTNNTERMRIDSSGNLLVGTTSSGGRFTVKSVGNTSATNTLSITNSSGTTLFYIRDDGAFQTGSASASPYNLTTGSAANVYVDNTGFLYRSTSSLKYKKNVHNATHGLADLLKLRSVTYEGKAEADVGKTFGGLIAEEVDAAGLTEFVQYAEDGTPDALAYGNMVSLCIKAIQEQQALIQQLQADVAALKGK